jgi:hypothetical protein
VTAAFPSITALLLSVLMPIGGNSPVGIATPLRARIEGFPDLTIGLLGSVYFAGMLAGTLAAPAIIRRGGQYQGFRGLCGARSRFGDPHARPRFPMGLARLPRAPRLRVRRPLCGDRGLDQRQGDQRQSRRPLRPLSDYQIANFAASASGQLALKPLGAGGFSAFAVGGALLALAIVPMAMTSVDPPAQPRTCVPAFSGSFAWRRFRVAPCLPRRCERRPVRARTGFRPRHRHAALFTSSIVLGSALGVLPIAAISDRIDRRLVIAAVMIAGAASETALSRVAAPGAWLLVLGFLVGLTTYSLYTLAVSLANDHGAPHDLIFIAVGLLFIYCVAAIAAPALASVLMKDFGPRMLFIQNAYVHLAIAALALWGLLTHPRRAGTRPA